MLLLHWQALASTGVEQEPVVSRCYHAVALLKRKRLGLVEDARWRTRLWKIRRYCTHDKHFFGICLLLVLFETVLNVFFSLVVPFFSF